MSNKESFAKIPNKFFYNDGELLNCIGGRDSFVLYCFLVSRKNMADYTYISIKEINDVLKIDKNVSRSNAKIIEFLQLQKQQGLIEYDFGSVSNADVMKIKWINLYPNTSDSGWTKFAYNDFDIFEKVGIITYCVMWMLRMYTNHETKTAFLSHDTMQAVLACDRNKINYAIDILGYSKMFDVVRGGYNKETERNMNNTYKYTGNIDNLLAINDDIIASILEKGYRKIFNTKVASIDIPIATEEPTEQKGYFGKPNPKIGEIMDESEEEGIINRDNVLDIFAKKNKNISIYNDSKFIDKNIKKMLDSTDMDELFG